MLTEQQIKQIQEEEYFRYEVKKTIEKKEKKSFGEKIWVLINSSFGLWVLSTVVVGLFVSLYTDFKEKSTVKNQNVETERKLEIELSSRIQNLKTELQGTMEADYHNFTAMASSLDAESRRLDIHPTHIFPEYKDRTLHSLFFELEQLNKNEKDQDLIRKAKSIMNKIKQELLNMPRVPRLSAADSENVKLTKEEIAKRETKINNEKTELAKYDEVIRGKIADLLRMLETNEYLKRLSRI